MGSPGRRVVVVSADIGAGHDAAATELARQLMAQGFRVDQLNFLSLLPWPLHAGVRETYRNMLRWLPRSYDTLFALTSRSQRSVTLIRALLRPARRRLLRGLPADTVAVVTTYPFANQVIGPLRRNRRLDVPVITYITDVVAHPTWVAPGVDVYCVVHDAAVEQAKTHGATDVRVVRPLVSARFDELTELTKQQARQRFGLPERARLALIVAGSWGVGDIEETAARIMATGCAQPVVVCGRNEALYRRLRQFPGYVLGWVDDMPSLMRAADVIVENAGGLTFQESLVAGLPSVTYRPIAGHGRANAAILTRSGLTNYVASADRLQSTLTAILEQAAEPPARPFSAVQLASVVAETTVL